MHSYCVGPRYYSLSTSHSSYEIAFWHYVCSNFKTYLFIIKNLQQHQDNFVDKRKRYITYPDDDPKGTRHSWVTFFIAGLLDWMCAPTLYSLPSLQLEECP